MSESDHVWPRRYDLYEAKGILMSRSDPDPLKSTLMQELTRYNVLLAAMSTSLRNLQSGIKGITVITAELELVFDALLVGKVPEAWSFCYPSLKPLGSWFRDMLQRVAFFKAWLEEGMPKAYWLSGFTYPTGFLTALLQTSARKNGAPIDSLSWDFPVLNQNKAHITQHPKEGAYIHGIFLEGARWDAEHGCLADALPLELIAHMPVVHFKPVDNKKKVSRGLYVCPLYLYPIRTGTRERPSFMIAVEVKAGSFDANFWTKRGTALLLSDAS